MRSVIIIVGTGLAGMVAAHAAQQGGADVVLVDRGPTGIGTNSSLANGVFAGPTHHYGIDAYIQDTLETGRHINSQAVVRRVAQEAPDAFQFLSSLGIVLRETSNHHIVESPLPGVIPGVVLMRKLSETLKSLERIRIINGFYVTDILVRENRVCGVKGIDGKGKEISIQSPAVVLAAGGAGAIYLRNDNQKKILGQGYYLAAKAGLQLWDMEFVQFYPLVIAEPDLPQMIVYPPYPVEAKLINASGEDMIGKYNLGDINRAIRKKRDEISAWLFEESQIGPVYMDLRDVPDPLWETHPLSLLKKMKFDFRSKHIAVAPAAHFFMGGVRTDNNGQTDINGLFACGEVVWGLHGANRMGGNALTECMVTGSIAGRHAAQYCQSFPADSPHHKEITEASVPRRPPSKIDFRGLLRIIREIAWNYAGIVRSEAGMKEGLAKVAEIKRRFRDMISNNPVERIPMEDLMSALFTLEAILEASLSRQESRGSFIHKDFPDEDNVSWRKNSCLRYSPKEGSFSVDYSSG